jgi:EpsI family protein
VKARTAVWTVCALLAGAAAVSYSVGDRADLLTATIQLPHPLKVSVPAKLGTWTGSDESLPQSVLDMTKVTDYVRRRYVDADGSEVILYVAYHGNKERGLQTYYHNATVCFPSAGWTQESERCSEETSEDAAQVIPVCRYVFAKDGTRLSVLTFFKVDEEFLDQSPRNKPFWLLLDRATPKLDDSPGTFVQVQVIVQVGAGGESAASALQSRFLHDFGRPILSAVEAGAAR